MLKTELEPNRSWSLHLVVCRSGVTILNATVCSSIRWFNGYSNPLSDSSFSDACRFLQYDGWTGMLHVASGPLPIQYICPSLQNCCFFFPFDFRGFDFYVLFAWSGACSQNTLKHLNLTLAPHTRKKPLHYQRIVAHCKNEWLWRIL